MKMNIMSLMTSIFDLFTLKLVYESRQTCVTFSRNLGTLGFRVLELFTMYVTDRQKQRLLPPYLQAGA